MKLTNDQAAALKEIDNWIKDEDRWMFYLGGFAGTGKTFLLHHLINHLSDAPICLAPTGKAASVLQRKLDNAIVTTIHRALYSPVIPDISLLNELESKLMEEPNSEEIRKAIIEEKERLSKLRLKFVDNPNISIAAGSLVIVDEASMVSNRMMDDLAKTNAKVLFVGDPGQLPPVNDCGYFTYAKPDAMLEEVVRQAADNPIIYWSMAIRKGEHLPVVIDSPEVQKRPKQGFEVAELHNFDQVLCGTNNMRRRINRSLRKLDNREAPMPASGEKLICLKNKYKYGGWFTNGIQCISTSKAAVDTSGDWVMDVLYEGEAKESLPVYDYPFAIHYDPKAMEEPWQMRDHLIEMDYAYAITVHKSQGSEWDKVAMVDDGLFERDENFRRKWLYTAVTRAKEQLLWLG